MKKTKLISLLIVLCSLFFVQGLFAQQQGTAAYEIEELLNTSSVTYGQSARFILEASDKAVFSSADEAFLFAREKNWLTGNTTADQPARLDVIAKLFMNAFEIKGGLFYTLTGGSLYAYRELVYLNIIQGKTEPGMKVSGDLLLFITGRVLTVHGGI